MEIGGRVTELDPLLERLADLVADRVVARLAPAPQASAEPDRLLTLDQAARRLGVTPAWLRRHSRTLPFARKMGHRTLRFSSAGIDRWISRRGAA